VLGRGQPRWAPTSWDDVVAAAGAGLLDETHWVELKEAIPASSKPANLELARDLASLAADGGLLVVGVRDDHGKAGDAVGTDNLPALRDRIDQVARSTIHPPLSVSAAAMADPSDSTRNRGCLLVSVPASPDAPHMVDKHYWGRSDTGKRKLEDHDVQRYFAERRLRSREARSRLHAWIDSPSVHPNDSTEGRLYVTASPRGGRNDEMAELLYQGDGSLPKAIRSAADGVTSRSALQLPISRATNYYRAYRLEGYTTDDRDNPGTISEGSLVVIEVHEDGTINVLHGRVTMDHLEVGRIISLSIVREIVQQSVRLATVLGEQVGYYGAWDLGVHITQTRGAGERDKSVFGGVTGAYWGQDTYEEVISVTSDELAEQPLLPLARPLHVERELATSLGLG
jgi:hypothetical protein